jgi:hypothetical protein
MKILRSFIAPLSLREDEYVFTLDHDGGLVVSLEVLEESGALESQLQGVRILKDLEKKKRNEETSLDCQNPV